MDNHLEASIRVSIWLTDFLLIKMSFQKTLSGDNYLQVTTSIHQIIVHLPSYATITLRPKLFYTTDWPLSVKKKTVNTLGFGGVLPL